MVAVSGDLCVNSKVTKACSNDEINCKVLNHSHGYNYCVAGVKCFCGGSSGTASDIADVGDTCYDVNNNSGNITLIPKCAGKDCVEITATPINCDVKKECWCGKDYVEVGRVCTGFETVQAVKACASGVTLRFPCKCGKEAISAEYGVNC